jgi:hypothetical protein
MIRAGHPHRAAESLDGARDPLVVGRDNDRVDAAGRCGPAIDVLDHRTSGDVGERLGWKA